MSSPRQIISEWIPHGLMLLLVGLAVWLTLSVFAPLRDAILLGVAVATLTYPVLFEPLDAQASRLVPNVSPNTRRNVVGAVSTVLLVLLGVSPMVLLVVSAIGDLGEGFDVFLGIVLGESDQNTRLIGIIVEQTTRLKAEYNVPLDPLAVRDTLQELLNEARNFAPTFLSFLFKGTGSVMAQYILSLVVSTFCYANGPQLVNFFLSLSPLSDRQSEAFKHTHRNAIFRLLYDTAAQAAVKGLLFGLLMLVFARVYDVAFFDNFIITSSLAAFISLVPVVGVTVVWLPLAMVLYRDGHPVAAGTLAVLCFSGNGLVDYWHKQVGRRFGHRSRWMGLMLFLSLIGGVLGFGLKGLIVGPTAVVITAVLGSFWLPLYGIGEREGFEIDAPTTGS